jgi:MFS family permease
MTASNHTSADARSIDDRNDSSQRLIRTLTLTIFLQWMGGTSLVPMLPLYIRRLHGTDALAGVVIASYFAAGVLTQYPAGRLADRIGRRPVLIAGLLTYGIASVSFLFPITAAVAVGLRALQGIGVGAATVASLAIVSSSVSPERRGRAFATVYGGEIAGMAIGPLVGSIVGVGHMWIMFLASGLTSLLACVPASLLHENNQDGTVERAERKVNGRLPRPEKVGMNPAMGGALICAGSLGLATGVYDICWTLLLVSRGASGVDIGISWTLFAVPFVAVAKPSGWLADHADRRMLVLSGIGLSTVLCASYPFIHNVPALVALGALEALGFAAALPAVQSLLTQGANPTVVGRVQGMFATSETAFTAVAAAGAGAAFALSAWVPFVAVASIVFLGLVVTAVIWRNVEGKVAGTAAVADQVLTPDPASDPV